LESYIGVGYKEFKNDHLKGSLRVIRVKENFEFLNPAERNISERVIKRVMNKLELFNGEYFLKGIRIINFS
jgi:hypothetical protein